MSTLHMLIGPVGAGKSTFARDQAFKGRGVFLDLDTWMVRLFGKDPRPQEDILAWYVERRDRCRRVMWDLSQEILGAGTDVFLELGLVAAAERDAFYRRAREEGVQLRVCHADAPRDVRRQRVADRNSNVGEGTQVVPMEFFERASDAWEAPSDAERLSVDFLDI